MARISGLGEGPRCSVARSLEVLGDKWTLLIIRDALLGVSRFSEFRERLGMSPAQLSSRLHVLVASGILEETPYRESGKRTRQEYRLTQAGLELKTVIASLMLWGDRHRPRGDGPSKAIRDSRDNTATRVQFIGPSGQIVPTVHIQFIDV